LLRSGQDHRADLAGAGRMGSRPAAIHGADAVSAAGELARQALRNAARGHAHHHHGEEPADAVRGGAEFPRRGEPVITAQISTSLSGSSSGLVLPGARGKCSASTAPHCAIAATNPSATRPCWTAWVSASTAFRHTSGVTF